jgi:hypothetical protein
VACCRKACEAAAHESEHEKPNSISRHHRPRRRLDWAQASADLDARGCAVLKGLRHPRMPRPRVALLDDEISAPIVMGRHGSAANTNIFPMLPDPSGPAAGCGAPKGIANVNEPGNRSVRHHEAPAAPRRGYPATRVLQYGLSLQACIRPRRACVSLRRGPARTWPLARREFALTEQGRACSRPEVLPLTQGDAVALLCITGRCRGRAASIGLICAMASARSARPPPYRQRDLHDAK